MPGPPPLSPPLGETAALVTQMADELARRLPPDTAHTLPTPPDAADADRQRALIRLRILADVKQAVRHLEDQAARAAAASGAGYPEIGKAMGMSRQGARRRWPGLITTSTPRPPLPPTPRSS